jgi:hypothetical protein
MMELPISRERLERLCEDLSPEARLIMHRWVANLELEEELQQTPEEVLEGFEDLPQSEKDRILAVSKEIGKGYERRMRENEAYVGLSRRAMGVHKRAAELDDSITDDSTTGECIAVLKAHGESVPFSEEELELEIEVPPDIEDEDIEWVAIPESEMPTDANGIPTRAAAKDGFAVEDPDGSLIKLYPMQVEAMRAVGKKLPYKSFIEEELEDLTAHKRDVAGELRELDVYDEKEIEELSSQMVSAISHRAYLYSLAAMVKATPGSLLRRMIDFYKDRDTKAAGNYKKWLGEHAARDVVKDVLGELVEEGVFEAKQGDDGKRYLRPGPNFEKFKQEREEEDQ